MKRAPPPSPNCPIRFGSVPKFSLVSSVQIFGGGRGGVNFSLSTWSDQHNSNWLPYAKTIKVLFPSFLSIVERIKNT